MLLLLQIFGKHSSHVGHKSLSFGSVEVANVCPKCIAIVFKSEDSSMDYNMKELIRNVFSCFDSSLGSTSLLSSLPQNLYSDQDEMRYH